MAVAPQKWAWHPQKCYIGHLLFHSAHSVKISAQTDQNCQSCILKPLLGNMEQKGRGHPILAQMGSKLLHCQFTFSFCTFCENFSPNRPKLLKLYKGDRGRVQGQNGVKSLYETTNFYLSAAFYRTQLSIFVAKL